MFGTGGTSGITNEGSGPLVITDVINRSTGTKILELRGTNTDLNVVSVNLANGTGTLAVTKTDTGIWVLAGNNSGMSGAVAAASGLLIVTSANALGTGTYSPETVPLRLPFMWSFTNAVTQTQGTTTIFTGDFSIQFNGVLQQTTGGDYTIINNILGPSKTLTFSGVVQSGDAAAARTLIIGGAGNTILPNVIQNNTTAPTVGLLGLNYSGSGTLRITGSSPNTLTGNNTFSGPGTLILDKSGANSRPIGTGVLGWTGNGFLQATSNYTTANSNAITGTFNLGNGTTASTATILAGGDIEFTGTFQGTDANNTLNINNNTIFSGGRFNLKNSTRPARSHSVVMAPRR